MDALLQKLPEAIARAVYESGILALGGDFTWLLNPRHIAALMLANKAHGGKLRKRGGKVRLIHEVCCAHKAQQLCNIPWVKRRLAREGVDAEYVVFAAIVHDLRENFHVLKKQEYDDNRLLRSIAKIWNDPLSFPRLKTECLDFITDKDPMADTATRIAAQKAKGYYVWFRFSLSFVQQLLRPIDKDHHNSSDADFIVKEAARLRETNADEKVWADFRSVALECAQKSQMKSYVLDYATACLIRHEYRRGQLILNRAAKGSRDPGRSHIFQDFTLAVWSLASRLYTPIKEAKNITFPMGAKLGNVISSYSFL
jgi:hypothetical protein